MVIKVSHLQFTNSFNYSFFVLYSDANATKKLVAGELTQLKRLIIKKPKENDYYKIIEGKTASLFEDACKAGASSTSDNLKQINTLGVFGKNLGMAYQLKDDLFAYENYDIGKPIYNEKGKVMNGPNYFKPNLSKFIN